MLDVQLESGTIVGQSFGPFGRRLLAVAKYLAIAGGLVFVVLVAMSIVSITGRKLFSWTVPGDVELLQMCAAFAASNTSSRVAFVLPYAML